MTLSDEQLGRLKAHKYSAEGGSILEPYFQKYWVWLVEKCPVWVAPNLITLVGLIINIVTSLILVYYNPTFSPEHKTPGWAFVLCGVGLFAYQSLDAIDGKQARRTGSSTPLGELFDHGCDSLSTVFVVAALSLSIGLFSVGWFYLLAFVGLVTFYVAHWRTYVTGKMFFGKFDVTETNLIMSLIHIATGLVGQWMWSDPLPVIGLPLNVLLAGFVLLMSLKTIVANFDVIMNGGVGPSGTSAAGTSVLAPLIPIGLVFLGAYLALDLPICSEQPMLVFFIYGFAFSLLTNKLIVGHMSKSALDQLDLIHLPAFLIYLNWKLGVGFSEYYVALAALVFSMALLGHYCVTVCIELCNTLNIYCFKIKPILSSSSSSSSVH